MKGSGIGSGMKAKKEGMVSEETICRVIGFTISKERHRTAGQPGADCGTDGEAELSWSPSWPQSPQQDFSAFATDAPEIIESKPVNMVTTESRITTAMILIGSHMVTTIALRPFYGQVFC